jgi:hypothetical protein
MRAQPAGLIIHHVPLVCALIFRKEKVVGQAKNKQIECPVTGRKIKPAVCGENRISNYACPAECPHNPWSVANYDRALEINDRFTEKILSRLRVEHVEKYGCAQSPPINKDSDEFAALIWFSDQFYREKDSEGRTFKDRWEARRFEGLNNDQQIMLEAESKMRAVVLEIQQVLDDSRLLAVDLLDSEGKPFVVVDRSLASSACRFTTLFVMVYDMPHYSRIHSAGCPMPDVTGIGMREVFMEVAHLLGAPLESPALRDWASRHIRRVVDSLRAVFSARHAAMLRSIDATYTKTVYNLECTPEKFRGILETQKDIEPEGVVDDDADEGFEAEWVYVSEENPLGHGPLLVGRILLHREGYIQLESSSQARTEQLKERIEGLFGVMIRFSRERSDDLGTQLFEKRARDYDSDLVPKRLVENTARIETSTSRVEIPPGASSKEEVERYMAQEFLKNFMDKKIPSLDGLTPRQAAKDSAVRPKLVELMKSHVRTHDENNLRKGLDADINWMLEELGLGEINFPPPPLRKPTQPVDDEDEDGDEELDYDQARILDAGAVRDRIQDIEEEFSPARLRECLAASFPEMHDFLVDVCNDEGVSDRVDPVLELAAQIGFMHYRPDDRLIPGFPDDLVATLLEEYLEEIGDGDFEGFLDGLYQPMVAVYAYTRLKEMLRFGKTDPLLINFFVTIVAFSEAVNIHFEEMLQLALENPRRQGGARL